MLGRLKLKKKTKKQKNKTKQKQKDMHLSRPVVLRWFQKSETHSPLNALIPQIKNINI